MAKKRVLGVVGMGHVGAHVAYALAIQGIADELVLVDQNEQKLASEVQDLRDAVAYMPHRVTVRGGDFSDLGVCDVIVNSVGKIDLLRGTHDRVTEMDFTIPAVRGYAEKIKASGFDGVLINITNPCDIVTRELALHLGLPRGRVFGTGTGLDTSRLLSALARQTGLDHKSITCYMMGEHGNQQFAPWSCVSFRGVPLDEWAKTDERFRFDRDALQKESIGGGWVTFSGKFCTEYGIANAVSTCSKELMKFGLTVEEFAALAQKNNMSDAEVLAVTKVFEYLKAKKGRSTVDFLLRTSRLPLKVPKTFDNFDFNRVTGKNVDKLRSLSTLSALYAHKNLAFIGKPRTGKTHLAQAFGRACCEHGMKAYFIKMSELRDRMADARRAGRESTLLASLVRPSCLIIDEVGHCEFGKENTQLFFDMVDRRYQKDGYYNMVFTSNRDPAQ